MNKRNLMEFIEILRKTSIIILILFASNLAQLSNAAELSRIYVDGTRLVYDTEEAQTENQNEIKSQDVTLIKKAIEQNPQITTVQLNSVGGLIGAAFEITEIIIEHGLDTVVNGSCLSACTLIFLAGTRRSLADGSSIGFHQHSWEAKSLTDFYKKYKAESNWNDPFEFTSWIVGDTQTETLQTIEYMVSRGVDAHFATETLKANADEMWIPTRLDLETAGVITERKNIFQSIKKFLITLLF